MPQRPAYLSAGLKVATAATQPPPAPPAATVVQLPGTQPAPLPPTPRPTRDLERMQRDYEQDVLTTREIGRLHGISHARVIQYAKKLGWSKPIKAAALLRANAILNGVTARRRFTSPPVVKADHGPQTVSDAVEAAASVIVAVKREHRTRLMSYRDLAERLLRELAVLTDRPDLMEEAESALLQLHVARAKVDDTELGATVVSEAQAKVLELATRISGLPGRVKTLKDLADVLKTLIALERQAFDLDGAKEEEQATEPDRTMTPAERYRWFASLRPTGA